MEKLYAYALDRKKTCSHAKFKSITATVIELRFFMKKKMTEDEESVKIIFTCIAYLM